MPKSRFATLFIALLLFLSACAPAAPSATSTPEFGSGSAELNDQANPAASFEPEPVSTLSAEKALELSELGWIAFTASDGGRRDVWLIRSDGSGEYNLTANLPNIFAEAPVWAPDGRSIAFDGVPNSDELREIYLVTVEDQPQQYRITDLPGFDCYPSFSPDGEQIVYMSEREGNRDLYIMDREGNDVARLTEGPAHDYEPAWSPDGSRIVFTSRRTGNSELFLMDADGGNVVQLTEDGALDWRPAWSPDGEWIAWESWRNGNGDVFIMRADGSAVQQLTTSGAEDGHPHFSPDGTYLIFHSQRTGNYQLFILDLSNPEDQWHLPTKSVRALLPVWSPAGALENLAGAE